MKEEPDSRLRGNDSGAGLPAGKQTAEVYAGLDSVREWQKKGIYNLEGDDSGQARMTEKVSSPRSKMTNNH